MSTAIKKAYGIELKTATLLEHQRAVAVKAGMATDAAGNLVITSKTKGLMAYQAALLINQGALSKKAVITAALTNKIKLTTAAQWLWNAAMLANPIGVIVAGVAALGLAIAGLVVWLNRETDAARVLRQEYERLRESINAHKEAVQASADAHERRIKGYDVEIRTSQQLLTNITDLKAGEDELGYSRERMITYVNLLNQSMEGLNLQYDKETGQLSMSTDAIAEHIAARESQIRVIAAQERAVEIAREQIETDMKLTAVQNELADAQRLLDESSGIHINQRRTLEAHVRALTEAEQELTDKQYTLGDAFEHVTAIIVESMLQATESICEFAEETERATQKAAYAMEAMAKAQEAAFDSLASEYQTLKSAATEMFRTIRNESYQSFAETKDILMQNRRDTKEWAENIDTLFRWAAEEDIENGFLHALEAAGPSAGGTIRSFVEQIAGDLEGLKRFAEEFEGAGEDSIQRLAARYELDEDVARAAANAALNAVNNLLGIRSPSRVFAEIGKNMAEGYIQGLVSQERKAGITNSKRRTLLYKSKSAFHCQSVDSVILTQRLAA